MLHYRLHQALARERTRELTRRAAPEHVTIRPAVAGDASALRRLAQLDSRPQAAGDALVAEVDGELRAALPLDGSQPVADPFRPTASLLSLLTLRARQL